MMLRGKFLSFVIKECRHILRDPQALVMLFMIPLALVMLFGYVISTDINNTPVAVLDQSFGDPVARRLVHKFQASQQFQVVEYLYNDSDIDAAFKKGVIKMVIVIPPDFGAQTRTHTGTHVQLVTDASDLNIATTIMGYASAIVKDLNAELNVSKGIISQQEIAVVRTNVRMMYNPELRSAYMFVPGVIALIVMIVAAMMTSVTLAREKESGTLRLLRVSPLKSRTIIIGKVLPYFVLTAINTTIIMLLGMLMFGMPCESSLWSVALLCGLFILSAIGLGILISALVKNQQSALIGSLLGLFLPTVLLSGFIFPLANMPDALQWVCKVVPATWFIEGLKGMMLKGQSVSDLWLPLSVLAGMAVVFISLALGLFSRRDSR